MLLVEPSDFSDINPAANRFGGSVAWLPWLVNDDDSKKGDLTSSSQKTGAQLAVRLAGRTACSNSIGSPPGGIVRLYDHERIDGCARIQLWDT